MDSFNIIEKLGKGTFGTVHLCERKHNKLKIVVKEIHADIKKESIQKGNNEVAILKSLKHPNIIRYYDSFMSSGSFYIVMEYATTGNLHDYILEHKPHFFDQNTVLGLFSQILFGLDHIHSKNIIHRDLKCENIFLTGKRKNCVKIGDFGVPKILLGDSKTQTIIGTTNYLAPEICDSKSYDQRSDIWSLGCVLYEICAMERMFEGPIAEVIMAISKGRMKFINMQIFEPNIQVLIDSMLQVDPVLRPHTKALMSSPLLSPTLCLVAANIGCIFDSRKIKKNNVFTNV